MGGGFRMIRCGLWSGEY